MDGVDYRFGSQTSLFPETVETERLRLERLDGENVGLLDLYEFLGPDLVAEEVEHLQWEPHATPMDTKRLLEQCGKLWRDGEQASYLFRPTGDEAGALAGITTFAVEWERRVADLGIFLRKRFWGREYSAERARALVGLAFEHLDLEVVEVNCSVENERARRAIEKYVEDCGGEYLGRRYNKIVRNAGDPMDSHVYAITREGFEG